MNDLERLQSLLETPGTFTWMCTDDEPHALGLVRTCAMAMNLPVRQWDVVTGIKDGLVSPGDTEADTEHPAAALIRFTQYTEPAVCVMLDPLGHLGDERTLRAMREAVDHIAHRADIGLRLVLIDHRDALPPVLHASALRLTLTPPDAEEVEELVKTTIRRISKKQPIEAAMSVRQLATVVQNLQGLSRRQIQQVVSEAALDDRRFDVSDLPRILERKRQLIQSEGLLEFVQAPTDMAQIGGLGRLKLWLKQREKALTEDAKKFGLDAPRGVLMLGVQGAGKSLCAKAIATAWKRPLMRLDPGVLYDRYIGESERRLRDALKQAEMMAPVVLWIDEIEKAFASAASRSIDGGLSQRMFGTLLTWMQEHKHAVFVAATANDIEALPPELLRKGRFDEIFFVDLPGEEARRSIIEIHLRKRGRDPAGFDIARIARTSEGHSGAEIEQGIIAALHEAFSTKCAITTDLIDRCIRESPPISVTMAERISELRSWAKGRCVPAE